MKKILIFYGSYGGGHLSAAKSIKQFLEDNRSDVSVTMVDCIEYINRFLNKVTTKAYSGMAKKAPWMWKRVYFSADKGALSAVSNTTNKVMAKKLGRLINVIGPDFIISTHPFSSQMCTILKKKKLIDCKVATILTDFAIHNQWLVNHDFIDYYFVAHQGMKNDMIKLNIPENKISVTGIPLSNRFSLDFNHDEIFKSLDFDKTKNTVLFFGGGEFGLGKSRTVEILEGLVDCLPTYQIIAIAGRNEKMLDSFNGVVSEKKCENRVRVFSFTDKVPEFMSICKAVITKPGGLTTTESLSCGLPMLIINPIPGQEEQNAQFLENANVGKWLKKNDDINDVISKFFISDEALGIMKKNCLTISNKNSTKDICEIILKDEN